MRTRPAFAIAVAVTVVTAGTARPQTAGPQATLDGFVGGIFPDGATRPEVSDAFTGGGRVGLKPQRWFAVEGTFSAASNGSTRLNHVGVDAVFDLLPERRAVPYVLGGWTRIEYDHDPGETQTLNGWEFGAGAKVRLVPRVFVRLDARDALVEQDAPHEWLHNPIVTGGVHLVLGGRQRDTDADGVADAIDRCPDTPAGAIVDATGCPLDADRDGVFDGLDRCPDTPAGTRVDATGCPLDGDRDGVFDGLDRCPDTPAGTRVDASGCPAPESAREAELVDTGVIRLHDVRFATGKATITRGSYAVLDEVGAILVRRPELAIEIGGHTDSTGDESFNQQLSERRARAVLDHLEKAFPSLDPRRFSTRGYGESQPIGDNRTRAGRAQNRRVEFKVAGGRTGR